VSNTELWDKLKRVPPEHLKGFTRGGGFKGTAIKPMYTFHKMTEVFGPVGRGWGIDEPTFQIVSGVNNEVMVYCTVSVWIGHQEAEGIPMSGRFYGVGGDKVVSHIKANEQYKRPERWENDDEAFKKAYTDALTNALKLLGAGADVHMGLWNGSKYIDEDVEPEPHDRAPHIQSVPMPSVQGTPGSSKAADRDPYQKMVTAIRDAPSTRALKEWYQNNVKEIDELNPDFVDQLRVEYNDRLHELKTVAA
jgi:hypothetical protein